MWEVIVLKRGKEESIFTGGWSEAVAVYDKEAATINATDREGNYLEPDVRISIRRAGQAA